MIRSKSQWPLLVTTSKIQISAIQIENTLEVLKKVWAFKFEASTNVLGCVP